MRYTIRIGPYISLTAPPSINTDPTDSVIVMYCSVQVIPVAKIVAIPIPTKTEHTHITAGCHVTANNSGK